MTTRSALLTLGASLPLLTTAAFAADQTYDDLSGSNVWDLATSNWDASANLWTNGNAAIFGGTGEAVAVNAAVAVGNLTFNSAGYDLTNGTGAAITLNGGSITVTNSGEVATINEVLAGAAGFTKAGAGILHLRNANTYTGDTLINTGILRVGDGTTKTFLGVDSAAGTNRPIVASGATLQVFGNNSRYDRKEVHLSGTGVGGTQGALYVDATGTTNGIRLNHQNTTPATTYLDADATIRIDGAGASGTNVATVLHGRLNLGGFTLTKAGTGALGFEITNNSITGPGTLVIAEGVVKSNQNNTFNNNFNLDIDAGAELWVQQTGSVVNATTSTLTLDGTLVLNARGNGTVGSDTTNAANKIGNLAGVGTITSGKWGNTGNNTLTLEPSADFSFAGTITQVNGTVNLAKAGAAIVTLTGSTSYNGTTTVSGGELIMGNGGSGGAIGAGNVTANATLTFNRGSATTAAGSLLGSGIVNQNGSGTVSFTGPNSTFFGATNVNTGKLFVKNASGYGTSGTGNVTIAAGASFGASGTFAGSIIAPGGATQAAAATIDLSNNEAETLTITDITPVTFGNAVAGEATYLTVEAGATADKLVLDGDLVVEQGGLKIQVSSLGIVANQTYDIVTFASASGAGFATGSGLTTIGGIELLNPAVSFGVNATLTVSATGIQLVTTGAAAPGAAYWSGSKGSSWTSTGGGQGNFTTTAPGGTFIASLPGSTTDVFFSNNSPVNLTNTLGANFVIDSLTFRGTSAAASIGGAEQLTLQAGGITVESGNGGAALGMTTLALGETQTWTNSSANPLLVTAAVNGGLNELTLAGNSIVLGGASFATGALTVNAALDVAGTPVATGNFGGAGSVTNSGASATLHATVELDSLFSGALSDGGAGLALALLKDGSAKLTLSGPNSHTGTVTISDGILALGHASALGDLAGSTVVNNGGTLDLNGRTITETLLVTGAGDLGDGALINSDTVIPAVIDSDITNGSAFTVGGDGSLELRRAGFTGPTIVTMAGAGTVTLGNAATAGHFNLLALSHVSTGTVNLGISSGDGIVCDRGLRILGGGTVRVTGTSNRLLVENCEAILTSGTFDLNGDSLLGPDAVLGGVGGGGVGRVTLGDGSTDGLITGGAASTLELNGTSGNYATNAAATVNTFEARSGSVDAVLSAGPTVNLNKTSAGTVTLLQNNTLQGKTVVSEGTLSLAFPCLSDTADVEITTTIEAGGFIALPHGATDVVKALIVDGVPVEAGETYGGAGSGADNIVSYLTGSGRLEVASGYASWASANGIDGELPEEDFDKDGIPNLMEYALAGLIPTQSDPSPGSLVGNVLTFSKRAEAVANGDVGYSIQESTTLGVAPDPWATAAPLVEDDTAISFTLMELPKQFARLIVTQL